MPLERVSIGFKDISNSLLLNPLSKDIAIITNETAIARSIRNLVLTNRGERFFQRNLGSKVSRLLFENMDESTADLIRSEIRDTIENYEPRVILTDVIVNPDYSNNAFNISIFYNIVGIDALPQQLSFVLLPTR
jgi:phage baseplate assembly protein W